MLKTLPRTLRLLSLILLATPGLLAADAGSDTFGEIAGHEFGERITVHHEMARFLAELDRRSARVRVTDQGASWEGRRLLVATVTSPENHARIDEIQATARKLGDPRTLADGELDRLLADQPVVVWMGGSIHGFELSGSEGLLKLLERLALSDEEAVQAVLDDAVILIDPMLNPDGRDAFAAFNHQRIGREPNPLRADWANATTRWQALQFRTGHYFFDTNRDWFAHTQRETRARAATIQAWRPQVIVDAHEMGPDIEFYFDPATEPYGSHFPDFARRWFARFGAAYAGAFDAAGFEYTTRELFNYFYPGYTTSWGSYQGAVGMLYEQGSSRGLALERSDATVRSLADALEQQYTAAWTAARFAAGNREELLREYVEAHRAAIADGSASVRWYLLGRAGDPLLVREAVDLLGRNGITVEKLTEDVELEGVRDRWGRDAGRRSFEAGTFVVDAAQPRNRLIRALLEPSQSLPEDFLAEARERLDRGENPRFYDITAWSLPLLFDLEGHSSSHRGTLPAAPLGDGDLPAREEPAADAGYAYLVDGRSHASLAVASHLRRQGHRATVLLEPTRIAGREVAAGSVVARVGKPNGDSLHGAVRDLAARYGVSLGTVATGLSEEGLPSLGSVRTIAVRDVDVALLAEGGVHGYSFGWAWYTLDRQYEIPTTVLPARTLARTPLHPFETLVIPDLLDAGQLAATLGEEGLARVKRWVQDGGNLVALGQAVDFVRQHLGLTTLRSWYEENKEGEGDDAREPRRFAPPGAIFAAEPDASSWLVTGVGDELPFLVQSDRLYLAPDDPPRGDRRVALRHPAKETRHSGFAWPEVLERTPGGVLAYHEAVGAGQVVAFAEDLNFRAYWRGANRLFLNAVVLGPNAR